MVAVVLRLRLALWAASLRRDRWRVVVLVLGGLYGLGVTAGVVVGLAALAAAPADVARGVVVVGGAVLVLAWTVVPVVAFGVDPSLDPARFATLPVEPRRLVVGLLLAALVGVPGVLTLVVGLGSALPWAGRGAAAGLPAVAAGLLGGVLGVLTAVAAGRLLTAAAAVVLARRRAQEAVAVLVVLSLVAAGPALAAVTARGVTVPRPGALVDVLAWTPPGLAWAVGADVAAGAAGTAALRLGLAAAVLALLLVGWTAVLGRRLAGPAGAGGAGAPSGRAPGRHGRGPHLPDGARWAVAARCLRYWRRDPRYLVAAAGGLLLPLGLGALAVAGALPVPLLWTAGALAGLVLGTALHNDVALDGSAFWSHLAVGVRGVDDRAGRVLAQLLWALPTTAAVALGGAAAAVAAGRAAGAGGPGPDGPVAEAAWAAGSLASAVALLLAGTAVSSVLSAVRPYPAQAADESPFGSPSGAALPGALAQSLVLLGTGVLALPALVAALLGVVWQPAAAVVALALALGGGAVQVVAGVRAGGALVDRRGPELLAAVRRDR